MRPPLGGGLFVEVYTWVVGDIPARRAAVAKRAYLFGIRMIAARLAGEIGALGPLTEHNCLQLL